MTKLEVVQPEGYPAPRGYANGTIGTGRVLSVAGQIGWELDGSFAETSLVGQFGRALDHVVAIVRAGGGQAEDLASMTIFVTDIPAYRAGARDLGRVWRERLGRHYPAMALVGVTELVDPRALVEIQATAILSGESS